MFVPRDESLASHASRNSSPPEQFAEIRPMRSERYLAACQEAERRPPWRGAYWYYARSLCAAKARISRQYRDAGLGPLGAVGAFLIAMAFATTGLAGYLLSRRWPGVIRRHFAV